MLEELFETLMDAPFSEKDTLLPKIAEAIDAPIEKSMILVQHIDNVLYQNGFSPSEYFSDFYDLLMQYLTFIEKWDNV